MENFNEKCQYCNYLLDMKEDKGHEIFNWHLRGHNEENTQEIQEWEKEEWGGWKIVSDMLDNPDEFGIYPTGKCYKALYDFVVSQKDQQEAKFTPRLAIMYNQGRAEGEFEAEERCKREIEEMKREVRNLIGINTHTKDEDITYKKMLDNGGFRDYVDEREYINKVKVLNILNNYPQDKVN